jgi:hypothetical protein
MWDFTFSQRRVWSSESSGVYCRVQRDLMMEAARTSETLVDIQLRTQQYIPEDSERHRTMFFQYTKSCFLKMLMRHPLLIGFQDCYNCVSVHFWRAVINLAIPARTTSTHPSLTCRLTISLEIGSQLMAVLTTKTVNDFMFRRVQMKDRL